MLRTAEEVPSLVLDPCRRQRSGAPAGRRAAGEEFQKTGSSDFPLAFDGPIKALLPRDNPRTKYFDGSRRGYLLMDVDRERWLASARTVDSITTRTSPVTTTATFAVAAGEPGIVPA